jgi:hypothetical protein
MYIYAKDCPNCRYPMVTEPINLYYPDLLRKMLGFCRLGYWKCENDEEE